MRRSLQLDQVSVPNSDASSEDLLWAVQIMEAAYSDATGDHGFGALLEFYAGLSPSQREYKKALDQKFQELVELHKNGGFSQVMSDSESLIQQYSKLGDSWQLFNLHHLRGNSLYWGSANFDGAYIEFCRMLDIAERLASPYLSAKALGSLANICAELGQYDESFRYASIEKNLGKTHNLDSWQAHACIMLGNQFQRIGQYEQSLREYNNALGLANRLQYAIQIMECLENLGVVTDRLGRLQEANGFYRLASRQLDVFLRDKVLQPIPEIMSLRLNLYYRQGDLALRTGDLISAEKLFQKALQSKPEGMYELEARNYVALAEVYFEKKKLLEAANMLEAAMAINDSGQYEEIEWQARFIKGEILRETGDPQGAISSFQQSIEILERMRRNIKQEEHRQSFYTARFDPYKATVSLLYDWANDKRKALEFVDRAKSITLKEHLRILESSEVSGYELAGEYSLPIVEYFFTKDALLIFVTNKGKVEAVSQAISVETLTHEIQQYLGSIGDNNSDAFAMLARRLYDRLIAPIERYIPYEKSETLVILPDGPLHLLPFSGLQDAEGRFLIEKIPIAFAPSRSIFRYCMSLGSQTVSDQGYEALLIDGSAGLSSARDELTYLLNLYGSSALLLRPKNLPIFGRAAAKSRIIHFAGHAITHQAKPMLVLQAFPNEVHLDYKAISGWKLPKTQLVNLAGCNTGLGPTGEGEAPWGLIPAFLNAGTSAIIASLMPVDDSATKQLTCEFYDQLHKGVNKAKSLQRAQVALLQSDRAELDARPKSWIPYVLVGNPN
jgi:CHAT domain-containing protein